MLSKALMLLIAILTYAVCAQAQEQIVVTPETTVITTAPSAPKTVADDDTNADESPNTQLKRYRLQPSDVLNVSYRFTPEYNNSGIVVQPDGYVSLELVGNVRVAGLTLDEARDKIKSLASERLNDPELTIVLQDFIRPYIVVAGEVVVPGKFDLRDKTSALQAVLLAGGFKDSARAGQVLLIRRHNAETVEVTELKLNNLAKGSNLREDSLLQAGDMIYVPRNRLSKVERFVKLASAAAVFGFIF